MARTRGCLWLAAGLVVALLAGVVGFMVLSRTGGGRSDQAPAAGAEVPVVVAAQAVEVRSVLRAEDVAVKQMPVSAVPEGALRAVEEVAGKITLVALYPGEVILTQRLVDPNLTAADGRTAVVVAENEVLMAFPAADLMSKAGILKPGDHVDLLFSLKIPTNREAGAQNAQDELQTFDALSNVTIAATVAGQSSGQGQTAPPEALLLTVSPQDALVLKYVKDAGGVLDVVLRAPGDTKPYPAEPVDTDYVIRRYQIPIQPGR